MSPLSPEARAALERLQQLTKGRIPYLVVRWENRGILGSQRSKCDHCRHDVAVEPKSLELAELLAKQNATAVALLCHVCTGVLELDSVSGVTTSAAVGEAASLAARRSNFLSWWMGRADAKPDAQVLQIALGLDLVWTGDEFVEGPSA